MHYEITPERLEEMVLCIVHNELNEDETLSYAKAFAIDCTTENAIEVGDDGIINLAPRNR